MDFIYNREHELFTITSSGAYPVFFTAQYFDFLHANGRCLGLAYSSDLRAVMPYVYWKSRFLRIITCLYQPLADGNGLTKDLEKLFLDEFMKGIESQNICDRVSAPENTAVFCTFPEGAVYAPFATYKVSLFPKTYNEVFATFQARYRTAIRQAENSGVEVCTGQDYLSDFYELHKTTMARSEMYIHPYSYFKNYIEHLKNETAVSVAYFGGRPIGALLVIYTRHSAQYLYGCSSSEIKSQGAIKLLHAKAMDMLIKGETQEYDFVGARVGKIISSKLKGIQDFKSRFGTTLYEGVIWKKDVKRLRCLIYSGLLIIRSIFTRKKVPLDIIEQELRKL